MDKYLHPPVFFDAYIPATGTEVLDYSSSYVKQEWGFHCYWYWSPGLFMLICQTGMGLSLLLVLKSSIIHAHMSNRNGAFTATGTEVLDYSCSYVKQEWGFHCYWNWSPGLFMLICQTGMGLSVQITWTTDACLNCIITTRNMKIWNEKMIVTNLLLE